MIQMMMVVLTRVNGNPISRKKSTIVIQFLHVINQLYVPPSSAVLVLVFYNIAVFFYTFAIHS
jgi:hypothetical protein